MFQPVDPAEVDPGQVGVAEIGGGDVVQERAQRVLTKQGWLPVERHADGPADLGATNIDDDAEVDIAVAVEGEGEVTGANDVEVADEGADEVEVSANSSPWPARPFMAADSVTLPRGPGTESDPEPFFSRRRQLEVATEATQCRRSQ
ncbi:hypothetical protein [Streptomyces sp. NPDC058295]|uniref:hypothetical protein n=1 Tax=Streptomyces sp. NPDC058295 TaxID=3346431 RepID=UPI0036E49552